MSCRERVLGIFPGSLVRFENKIFSSTLKKRTILPTTNKAGVNSGGVGFAPRMYGHILPTNINILVNYIRYFVPFY
jgi:hypothetical protein